jgi:predicted ArsR family transcriptional regulator
LYWRYKYGYQELQRLVAASVLDLIAERGVIAHLERRSMKTTEKILEFIASQDRMVTLKEIQDALEIKASAVAGFLVALCKSGRLTREKIERTNGSGPKMQWAYKCVASSQQNG